MMPYSLHVAIILLVCLLFYKLLLQRQTYYRLNRLVLLTCMVLACLLPLVPVPQQFSFIKVIPSVNHIIQPRTVETTAISQPSPTDLAQTYKRPDVIQEGRDVMNRQAIIKWVTWLYWFGVAAFGINFLLQVIMLIYRSNKNTAIQDGIYHIIELETNKAPCSFGNYIFINPAKYDWDTYNQILIHEKIHIKERHSIDLILAELMLVMQWFNPFAWLYRKEVETNLEFLTDDAVLQRHKVDPVAYQWSLLQVSVPNYAMRIATNYNQSLLKKRIIMMDAKRSDIHTMWKYFMLLPVLAILISGLNKPMAISSPLTGQQAHNKDTLKKKTVNVTAAKPKKLAERKADNSKPANIAPADVKSATESGYMNIPVDSMIAYRAHGISSEDIKGFLNSGNRNITPGDIIPLHSHLIPVEYVSGLAGIGYQNLTLPDIFTLRSRGITVDYLKDFADIGYKNLSLKDIIGLQSRGITVDYLKGFADIGYKNLSLKDIITLQSHAIRPAYVKGFVDAGYKNMTINDIISLQSHGMTPE